MIRQHLQPRRTMPCFLMGLMTLTVLSSLGFSQPGDTNDHAKQNAPVASDPPADTAGGGNKFQIAGTESKQDAPEISRSAGTEGGVVVLWPRIIPASAGAESHDVAAALQSHLVSLVQTALPGREIDVRPEPERVCRQAGCIAMSVGILLARSGDGCVAVALISRPGQSPARLVPWVGEVVLSQEEVPFREHPESVVTISDFARCDEVAGALDTRDSIIEAAILEASR
jgi:hypothetical protein